MEEFKRPGIKIKYRFPTNITPDNLRELADELQAAKEHFWKSPPEDWGTCVPDKKKYTYDFFMEEEWQYLITPEWVEERFKEKLRGHTDKPTLKIG